MVDDALTIITLEDTDSTSSEASRRLQSGASQVPFAVIARRQNQGRGRRGKSWQSPGGNLYFSLALDGQYVQDPHSPLSLRVGVAIALWLKERFAIEVSLKWPNDLLFGAAKLGGILIEASRHGDQATHVIIGIGVNLNSAPTGLDQEATCLAAIIGDGEVQGDIFEYGKQCIGHVLLALASDHWRSQFNEFSLQRGQLVSLDDQYFALDGLETDGSLRLLPWQNAGNPVVCSSIYQSLRWLYQLPKQPLILVDAGNSQCKIYFYSSLETIPEPTRLWTLDYQADQLQICLRMIRQDFLAGATARVFPYPVYVASVNERGFAKVFDIFGHQGFRPLFLDKHALRLDFSGYDLQQMGIDRLALCEGASLAFPAENLIVVSCGTAHTVELIDRFRVYRGGWILPGLALKWQSLAEHTDGLPAISLDESWQHLSLQDRFGHQTKEAIVRGALWEAVGGLKELRRHMQETTDEPWRLVLTGGSGRLMATAADATFHELLIPWGLAALALGGQSPKANKLKVSE